MRTRAVLVGLFTILALVCVVTGIRLLTREYPGGCEVEGMVNAWSEVGDRLILGWLPGDHRQIEAQTPPAGMRQVQR